jgi:DNA polymerase III alpha subunit
VDHLPLDDRPAYELLMRATLTGSSVGKLRMKDILVRMKPDCIETSSPDRPLPPCPMETSRNYRPQAGQDQILYEVPEL